MRIREWHSLIWKMEIFYYEGPASCFLDNIAQGAMDTADFAAGAGEFETYVIRYFERVSKTANKGERAPIFCPIQPGVTNFPKAGPFAFGLP